MLLNNKQVKKKSIAIFMPYHPKPLWDIFFSIYVTTDELHRIQEKVCQRRVIILTLKRKVDH